jgi:hypothetical protein
VIEFAEPRTIEEARLIVNEIAAFLSAGQVRRLTVQQLQVSRKTMAEIEACLKKGTTPLPYNHAVRFYMPDAADPGQQPWTGRAFAHVRTAADVDLFAACLKGWLERDEEWQAATRLMLEAFALSREISEDRLLTATRWIERILGNAGPAAIGSADIDAITSVAITKAASLGHDGLDSRIRGSLKAIGGETNKQRLERLVDHVARLADEPTWRKGLVTGALKARDFRGQAAHGSVNTRTTRERDDFELAIVATECLAYLLMLVDFPLDRDAIRRVQNAHPFRHFTATWQHYHTEYGVPAV